MLEPLSSEIMRTGWAAAMAKSAISGEAAGRHAADGRRSFLECSENRAGRGHGKGFFAWPSYNKKVAGSGRLRRPSSQPAFSLAESGSQISVGKVAEPGNRVIEAGSATSEALTEIGGTICGSVRRNNEKRQNIGAARYRKEECRDSCLRLDFKELSSRRRFRTGDGALAQRPVLRVR